MVQGTSSGAGKSTLVAGLARVLARRGVSVAPFKAQNMSLNSAVAADGGEIARAQALQAQAARVPPSVDMNPVLIKPLSDTRAQLVLSGHAVGTLDAGEYAFRRPTLLEHVVSAFARLKARFDTVLVEGAGSPAEVNLREGDIANMGFAEAVDCPVLLVGDIDRGGVFAQFVGTLACLAPEDSARVVGFVVNRFRGDRALLEPGLEWLEHRTGIPVLGVLPWLEGLGLDAEDGFDIGPEPPAAADALRVVVPVYPRVSNHTDFDALRGHPQVHLSFAGPGDQLPSADLIILPGSKSVRDDLAFLRRQGWDAAILRHLRYGGRLIGICGGMQMLGRRIEDPRGVEGPPGGCDGLGLLDLQTELQAEKRLRNVRGELFPGAANAAPVDGYEIHAGVCVGAALGRPAVRLDEGPDGALSCDGRILATYVHGLFDRAEACAALLAWAGVETPIPFDRAGRREQSLDRLADCVERHLALARLQPFF